MSKREKSWDRYENIPQSCNWNCRRYGKFCNHAILAEISANTRRLYVSEYTTVSVGTKCRIGGLFLNILQFAAGNYELTKSTTTRLRFPGNVYSILIALVHVLLGCIHTLRQRIQKAISLAFFLLSVWCNSPAPESQFSAFVHVRLMLSVNAA